MKLLMSCKNKCSVCWSCDRCISFPVGADHFTLAEKDEIIRRIDTGRFKKKHGLMKDVLYQCYDYRYDDKVQEPHFGAFFEDILSSRDKTARLIMGDDLMSAYYHHYE